MWKDCKTEWKFQKSRQIWLLKNIYNIERLPVKYFKVLKKYIKSLPEGITKQRVLQEALSVIEDNKKLIFDDIEQSLLDNTQ